MTPPVDIAPVDIAAVDIAAVDIAAVDIAAENMRASAVSQFALLGAVSGSLAAVTLCVLPQGWELEVRNRLDFSPGSWAPPA